MGGSKLTLTSAPSKRVLVPLVLALWYLWKKWFKKSPPANSLAALVKTHGEAVGKLCGTPMPSPAVGALIGWIALPWLTLRAFSQAMLEHRHLHLIADLHTLFDIETFTAKFPLQPRYVVTMGPKNVEHVLKVNFDNYAKGETFLIPRFEDLLGKGIFNADGANWYHQRKTASHMFTQRQLTNHMWKVITKNTDRVVQLLLRPSEDSTIDIFNVMNRFTLDTIGEIGFARNIGALDNADSPFLKSFDRGQQIIFLRMVLPGWAFQRQFRLFHEWTSAHHFKLLQDYSLETVKDLRQNMNGASGDSFVGLFMREEEKAGKPHDEKFMQDLVLNFLIAGRDTTAQSLSWTLFLLCTHPDVEKQVLEEIAELCGDRDLVYEDLNRFTFLQAVVNESLRLYPSVPLDVKVALNDDTLPDGSPVAKGDVVVYNVFAMGRSKKIWGEDADEFKPERWLNKDFPNTYTYPVFNAGPRECLGKRLAWVEMKACLIKMLRMVKLELAVPKEAIYYDVQLTIGMASGLPCKVTAR